jgi:hypothetical protein
MHREFHKFDDPNDPAFAPLIEAGEGESEGFEQAEEQLIEHASHGDWGGTARITEDAEGFEEEQAPDPDQYGEADDAISEPDSLSEEPTTDR